MRKLVSIFICFWALTTFGQTQKLTLDDAIDYALKHNAEIQNASLAVEGSKQEVKSIVATGLPQLSVNGNFTHNVQIASQQLPDFISPAVYGVLINEGLLGPDRFQAGQPQTVAFGAPSSLTAMANLNQLVFDGTYFLGLKAAKEYVHLSELIQENTAITEVENVKKAFYAALITGQNSDLLQQSLVSLEKTYNETQEMYEAGFVEKLDVDRLAFAKANLETEINNIALQKQILMHMLKVAMGMDVTTELELVGDISEPSLVNANGYSLDNRIETKLLKQQLIMDSLNVKRYKVGYLPSLRLTATYQQNSFAEEAEFKGLGNTWNPGTSYGFNLSIPIFDGFYKKAKIAQAKIDLDKDKNTFINTQNQLRFQVEQAKLNVEMKRQNLANQRHNRSLAKNIYEISKIKFEEGVGSSFELIQAETDKTQAEISYSNALYELIVANIDLQRALGTSQPTN
ncbi:MAG: TolC family protein [Bacteroidia bacterium]|nr:TolC family protein [Bacteroidia bacterium]